MEGKKEEAKNKTKRKDLTKYKLICQIQPKKKFAKIEEKGIMTTNPEAESTKK